MENNKNVEWRAFMGLNERGQCCIPKYLRDKWNLKDGDVLALELFRDEPNKVILMKETSEKSR